MSIVQRVERKIRFTNLNVMQDDMARCSDMMYVPMGRMALQELVMTNFLVVILRVIRHMKLRLLMNLLVDICVKIG